MRRRAGWMALLFGLLFVLPTEAAPPKPKAKANPAQNLPSVDATNVLAPGTFAGTIASVPDADRMFTLKITYPEVRLKPGAKMPNLNNMHARGMQQILQQMHRAQQMPRGRGGYHHHGHASAFSNMMHMEQMYMQGQARMAQAMARAEQAELRLLQKEIQAIQNMYQVVPVTRDFDFQAEETVKVRIKDLPEQFDEKGNIKKYTKEERDEAKGKDKKLAGYESSIDNLKPGQIVLVSLAVHKKPKPTTAPSVGKDIADKDKDKDAVKDTDTSTADKDTDASAQKKMQVRVILIVKDSDAPQNSTTGPKRGKK